jgi:hypothetical protein
MARTGGGKPPEWLRQLAHNCAEDSSSKADSGCRPVTRRTDAAERARRVQQARLAAHVLHSRVSDPVAHTLAARTVFLSRFEREVDPDGVLDPQERARRAEHAKKAYFLRLALASSKARQRRNKAP